MIRFEYKATYLFWHHIQNHPKMRQSFSLLAIASSCAAAMFRVTHSLPPPFSRADQDSISFNPNWAPKDIKVKINSSHHLGSGGNGDVYSGTKRGTSIKFAVKIFKSYDILTSVSKAYASLKSCTQPNIVKTTALFIKPADTGNPQLDGKAAVSFSEICDGGDLAEFIKKNAARDDYRNSTKFFTRMSSHKMSS